MPGYQLKPRDGRKLNLSIKEHRGMVEKLNVKLKNVKEHDSPISQLNGLALKQSEEFAHNLNVKQIEYLEGKLTKVTQEMGGHTQTGSTSTKGEGKKENLRKSSERKRKRTETERPTSLWNLCWKAAGK